MPTTYYVANAGSNSNNGTSSGTPFQTIAKANSVALAGDTILLNRGDRFFETCTVPLSSLTYDAYGAAATFDSDGYCTNAPIIDGATAISGWSTYTSGVTTLWGKDTFAGGSGVAITSHTPDQGTAWVKQQSSSVAVQTDGTGGVYGTGAVASYTAYMTDTHQYLNPDVFAQADVTFKTVIAGDLAGVIVHAKQATEQTYYAALLGSDGTLYLQREANGVGANEVTVAGAVSPVVAGTAYTVKLTYQLGTLTAYINGTQKAQWTDPSPLSGRTSMPDPNPSGIYIHPGTTTQTTTTGVHVGNYSSGPLDTASGTSVNTYQVALASAPTIVCNGTNYCFAGVGVNSLADQQWFWYGGTLYFRNNAGTPANGQILASQQAAGVVASSRSGTTVQNIAVEHVNYEAYSFTNCSNLTMQNCYAQRTSFATADGTHTSLIFLTGNCANAVVQNNVCRQFAAAGVGGSTNVVGPLTIQFNKFYDIYELFGQGVIVGNTADVTTKILRGNVATFPAAQQGSYSNSEKGMAVLYGDNWLVERNLCTNGPIFGCASTGNNHTVRDNVFFKCGGGVRWTNIGLTGGAGGLYFADAVATAYTGCSFYRNVILDCPLGILVDSIGTANRTSFSYYNNVIVNVTVLPAVADITENGTASGSYQVYFNQSMSGSFENNLVYNFTGSGNGGMFFKNETSLNAWTTDYNLWGPDTTGEFNFKGTAYNTLAAYSAGQSRDTHSVNGAPTFANVNYTPPARPGLNEIFTALLAFRNGWRSPARHVGTVISNVTQLPAPDAGIEATYGRWGLAA